MSEEKAKQTAELNDRFRQRFGMPGVETQPAVPGQVVCTSGIMALPPETQVLIWEKVRRFEDFTEDNDPRGEHDFGAFQIVPFATMFWEIEYYADASCRFGSEDPSDITRCYRVLTIMLASEY